MRKEAVSLQSIEPVKNISVSYLGSWWRTFKRKRALWRVSAAQQRILPWRPNRRDFSGRYPSCPGGWPGGYNMSGEQKVTVAAEVLISAWLSGVEEDLATVSQMQWIHWCSVSWSKKARGIHENNYPERRKRKWEKWYIWTMHATKAAPGGLWRAMLPSLQSFMEILPTVYDFAANSKAPRHRKTRQ